MSVIFRASAVIGVQIDMNKLLQPTKVVKAFEHNYPKTMKFSPENGKPLWVLEQDNIPEYDECSETLGEYQIYYSTNRDEAFVGIGVSTKSTDFICLDDFDIIKKELKEFLSKLDMWDEDSFGVYVILTCC